MSGNVASRLARSAALPWDPTRRMKKAMSCAVFMPSVSTPSPLKAMSSANQAACSVASAWQWEFISSPR